jgi:PAS domain S-box-containing protein
MAKDVAASRAMGAWLARVLAGLRRRWVLELRSTAGLVGALLLVVLLATLALLSQRQIDLAVSRQQDALHRMIGLQNVVLELRLAEASARDLLLTGDPAALERYRAAVRSAAESAAFGIGSRQPPASWLGEAGSLLSARLAELERAVTLLQDGRLSEAAVLLPAAAGNQLTERLGKLSRRIVADAHQQVDLAGEQVADLSRRLSLLMFLAAPLGIALVGAAGFRINQRLAKRRRTAAEAARGGTSERTMPGEDAVTEGQLADLLDHAPVITWVCDDTGFCTYLSRRWYALTGQKVGEGEGWGWLEHVHPEDLDLAWEAFRAANAGCQPFRLEYRLRGRDGAYRWVIDTAAPRFAADGAFLGHVGAVLDIDERKALEERQQLLLDELNHRVKNILAVTHSVAHLTSLAAGSLEEFREVFDGRLEALAAANELLTASGWQSTSLEALLRRALLLHGEPGESRLELSVEDVPIGGVLVQDLTLALHELATNATKHGALSVPRGRVAVEAGPAVAARERLLRLVWRELDGPAVRAPTRQGFGTRLLRQLIIRRHGGRLEMDWRADGLVCSLELPLNGRREATT